jgi:hypothetical protein
VIYRYDLIRANGEAPQTLRVLWLDAAMLAVIDHDNKRAWPQLLERLVVEELLEKESLTVEACPPPSNPFDRDLSEKHIQKREENYAVIKDIVVDPPAVFFKGERVRRMHLAMAAHGVSRNTIVELLLRYLHGCMLKGALLPEWANCGAPGKTRPVLDGSPKRGRKRPDGLPPGVNIGAAERRHFNLAICLSYKRKRKRTLHDAYTFCVERFLSEEVVDHETGRVTRVPIAAYHQTGLPTLSQFTYWYKQDQDRVKVERSRAGPRVYDMAKRPLLSTAMSATTGPCSRFEIDATVLDIYVRSRGDRNTFIARPTLYVIIDVWSRMIVGIYIGLEPPSYVAAMMALANAVEDKVAFCARFGIKIEDWEWPARHLCGILLGDRGEMESAKIDVLLEHFNVVIENATAYRGDWKGTVESMFNTLQLGFKPYLDGYIDVDFRRRGSPDYRAEGCLNIDELTQVIIYLVLYHNNFKVLKRFPRYPGQVEDGVASIPVEIWEHGIATRTGVPRIPDPDYFRFALMRVATAKVTRFGIAFQGRCYSCECAIREHWFTKAATKTFDVRISYDKRDNDFIYVHRKGQPAFEVARLTDRSSECVGLTGWEAEGLARQDRIHAAKRRDAEELARAEVMVRAEQINDAARREADAADAGAPSKRVRISGIREARAKELAHDRREEATAFRPSAGRERESPQVPAIQTTPEEKFATPSMRTRLAKRKDVRDAE